MRSKQTTIPTLCQTQGQARLSVAYRATARNVHASACPELLPLTNDRKPSKFKGISLCIALNSFERKSPPSNTGVTEKNIPKGKVTTLVTRGKSTPNVLIGSLVTNSN